MTHASRIAEQLRMAADEAEDEERAEELRENADEKEADADEEGDS